MNGNGCCVHLARACGVPWPELARVLGVSVVEARDRLASYVDVAQMAHMVYGHGLDDDEAAAAWLLLED